MGGKEKKKVGKEKRRRIVFGCLWYRQKKKDVFCFRYHTHAQTYTCPFYRMLESALKAKKKKNRKEDNSACESNNFFFFVSSFFFFPAANNKGADETQQLISESTCFTSCLKDGRACVDDKAKRKAAKPHSSKREKYKSKQHTHTQYKKKKTPRLHCFFVL